jgi:hypothetical protein
MQRIARGPLTIPKSRCRADRDVFLCAAERELNLQLADLGDLNLMPFKMNGTNPDARTVMS